MTQRAIFVAPGWGKIDIAWYFLRKKFMAAGFDVIFAQYPNRGFDDISQSAAKTIEILESIRPHYEHITFIGHSMGGLIGRYIVQVENRCDLFDAYVSMNAPHEGTVMSNFALWSGSARQMKPRSKFYSLFQDTIWSPRIPVFVLTAGFDPIIIPHRSALLGDVRTQNIKYATHATMLVHPQVFHEIWSWLIYDIFSEVGFVDKEGFSMRFRPENSLFLSRYLLLWQKVQEKLISIRTNQKESRKCPQITHIAIPLK